MVAPSEQTESPDSLVWMLNFTVEGDWLHIPTKNMIRAYVPQELVNADIHFAWEVQNKEGEPLLESSIRIGVWLSDANLKLVCAKLHAPLPVKPHGSGKNGNVLKIDTAMALVKFMFPNESLEERKRMAAALTFRSPAKLSDREQDILQFVGELDHENKEAPEFQRIAKLAKQKLKEFERSNLEKEVREEVEKEVREKVHKELTEEQKQQKVDEAAVGEKGKKLEARGEAASSSTRKPSETPPSLRDFLKPAMQVARISLTRDVSSYGYRAYYPGLVLLKARSNTISNNYLGDPLKLII